MNDKVTQIMPDRPELIVLGKEARDFKNSEFGKYMLDMAATDAGNAAKELCSVNPEDTTRIIELQNTTKRLRDLNKWIDQAIQAADHEYAAYQQRVNEGES